MNTESPSPAAKSQLYSELKELMYEERASVGQRFLNYLIDIVLYYGIYYLLMSYFVFGESLAGESSAELVSKTSTPFIDLLVSYILLVLFYTVFEGITKGRTIGKMITGTKAIQLDGSDITIREAFLRSLIRTVPFEPFSAFAGNPWHDNWTKTKVVKVRK